jgi:hypothetical protein
MWKRAWFRRVVSRDIVRGVVDHACFGISEPVKFALLLACEGRTTSLLRRSQHPPARPVFAGRLLGLVSRKLEYAKDAADRENPLADRTASLQMPRSGRFQLMPSASDGAPAAIAECLHPPILCELCRSGVRRGHIVLPCRISTSSPRQSVSGPDARHARFHEALDFRAVVWRFRCPLALPHVERYLPRSLPYLKWCRARTDVNMKPLPLRGTV